MRLVRWLPWRRSQEIGVSRTGQAVALLRAELERPHSPWGDPDAQRRLCRGMRPVASRRLWHQIVARTRFFDAQVLDALSAGVDQIVICGAGYDDRALRFASPGTRFFELDHPATQADKARRFRAIGADTTCLTLVGADFRTDDVAVILQDCGHDATRSSLFVCEGLLVYLDQPTCTRLLSALSARAAPGSRLAASLATHVAGVDSNQVTAAANARRPAGRREPWRTILALDAHLDLIERSGWRTEQVKDAVEVDPDAPRGRTQLVLATPLALTPFPPRGASRW